MLLGRPLYRFEGDRLLREARDGYLPDLIAHWLRYANLAPPCALPAGGYAYPASRDQAATIARLMPRAVDASATSRSSWEAVASARRSGFAERLIFMDGRVASSRMPFDPTERSSS